jgi:Polysaccharide pyruvyl transferase
VDPAHYSHVVFVCGPFGNGWPITDFLERFAGRQLIGLNLTMLEPLHLWNPFDLLLERDSSLTARPEMAFLSREPRVPVVGSVLVHPQLEYKNGLHQVVSEAIHRLTESRPMAVVPIDTRLDVNKTGLRSPGEVESLIARMDVVVTTRLHGMVLALKNGVPVVAIDPIAGGAKIRRQADAIGWSICFAADVVDDESLQRAFTYCLTEQARDAARACGDRARRRLAEVRQEFLDAVSLKAEAK